MLVEGEPIMQVTGMSINYSVNGAFPKSMESCIAEKIDLNHPSPVKHGCDTGGVSSGSAQFAVRNKKMIFAAMNVGGTKNAMDGTEFDADTNYNSSTPVSGRFLRAIKTAMKP